MRTDTIRFFDLAKRCTAVAAMLFLCACSTIGYYHQAVSGHWNVMRHRVPVGEVIKAGHTDPEIKRKLDLVIKARSFATRELKLPDNDSYTTYRDLGRRFVVWNVFATPELSLEPIASCFLFVGCLSYRGFFNETEARDYAASLSNSGNDVFVGGVAAYSTLGWFDDPVLNTMLGWDDLRIIEVVFHELAHQKIYLEGDSAFNEGFATAVARVGIHRWLASNGELRERYARDQSRQQEFLDLLLDYRGKLQALYAGDESADHKRSGKAQLFLALSERYAALKTSWDGYSGYDLWMRESLNNAKLASIATYNDYVPAFHAILEEVSNDIGKFYAVVAMLQTLPDPARRQCLDDLPEKTACIAAL